MELRYKNKILGGNSGGSSGSGEVYSTEETRVGTWIDGKPLYRRVFQVTSPSSENTDTSILSLDENISVKSIDGMLTTTPSDGSVSPVNFGHNSGAMCACWFKQPLHCIYMRVGVAVQTNRPVELYLEYTKTTDQATIQLNDDHLMSIVNETVPMSMPVTMSNNEEVVT